MRKNFFYSLIMNQSKLIIILTVIIFNIGCSVNSPSQNIIVSDSIFIVNINAKTSITKNPVAIELKGGTYNVSVIGFSEGGAYDAWKPWFYKAKQNEKGEWKSGWINKYSFSSNEFPEVTSYDSTIYGNPSLALANAKKSKFILKNNCVVNFYIKDSPSIDNEGGISLRIDLVSEQNENK